MFGVRRYDTDKGNCIHFLFEVNFPQYCSGCKKNDADALSSPYVAKSYNNCYSIYNKTKRNKQTNKQKVATGERHCIKSIRSGGANECMHGHETKQVIMQYNIILLVESAMHILAFFL